jgi:phosphoserine phosphatase
VRASSEVILITVSGTDKPGLTASLTGILSDYGINILDLGQAVIHDTLSLGLMIEIPTESESAPVLKELLFRAHELDVQIRFSAVDIDDYEEWVGAQGKPRYILTLFGRKLTAGQIASISAEIADQSLNIEAIHRLSGRPSLRAELRLPRACVEFSLRGEPRDISAMRKKLLILSQELGVDIGLQTDSMFRRNRRLVAFDMDSTLIQTEVINELAEAAGVGEAVSEITEAAMRGELDFKESFRRRMQLLKGLDASIVSDIADRLPVTDGAYRLISTLKMLGYKTAIISGGFNVFGHRLQKDLGIDYVFANELEIENGKLTGRAIEPIIDGERKALLLQDLANREGIRIEQTIAVGDGANDLPMLNLAGLGIAFHAKPVVKANAEQAISNLGLDGILYLIGVRDREV